MLWHWFGAMVWRINIATINIARMWPGVYARTGLTLACSQRGKVGTLQLHLSHTYKPFYLLDLLPPPLSFLPSPIPLQPLKLIIRRNWLMGLSGPLINILFVLFSVIYFSIFYNFLSGIFLNISSNILSKKNLVFYIIYLLIFFLVFYLKFYLAFLLAFDLAVKVHIKLGRFQVEGPAAYTALRRSHVKV